MNLSWTNFFRRFSKTNALEIFKSIMSIANNALIAQLKDIHEYTFKSNQIKVIQCFLDERDVILFAKTEYEKNIILYSLFALKIDIIILLIFFLNALKMNQNKIIKRLSANVNFCILNDEIIIATFLNEIKTKMYIHILTNSKLALFNVFFKKNLANFRILRSNLSRRHWWNSSDERLIQLTKQIWSSLRTAKHFVSYHFSFRHFDHFRRRVHRETHQEVEIQRECETYTRIDESKKDILQRSKYSRCFHRQFRKSSLFDRECQSIIEKNHLVWRKNSNVYQCEINVD